MVFSHHKSVAKALYEGFDGYNPVVITGETKGEDREKYIKDFQEKPTYTFYDNMGIYIYNRKILSFIEKNKRLDVNDLVSKLLDNNKTVCGYISEEPYYWIDVGEHADYEKANEEFQKRRNIFLRISS